MLNGLRNLFLRQEAVLEPHDGPVTLADVQCQGQ